MSGNALNYNQENINSKKFSGCCVKSEPDFEEYEIQGTLGIQGNNNYSETSKNQNDIKGPLVQMNTSYIQVHNSYNTCRICLKIEDSIINLLDQHELEETVAGLYTFCTGLEIRENDNFPQHLCNDCFYRLEEACKLKKTAIETHFILKSRLEEKAVIQYEQNEGTSMDCSFTAEKKSEVFSEDSKDKIRESVINNCGTCQIRFECTDDFNQHLEEFHLMEGVHTCQETNCDDIETLERLVFSHIELHKNLGNSGSSLEVIEDRAARKRRKAKERKARFMAKQSPESLQNIRAKEAAAQRRRRERATSQEKELRKLADAAAHRRKFEQMSPEELEAFRAAQARAQQRHINRLTTEKREAHRTAHAESQRRYIDRLTPEQLEARKAAHAESQRRYIDRLTPEQIEARRIAHAESQKRYIELKRESISKPNCE